MPAKWDPDKLDPKLRRKQGIHWTAPGAVADQDDYPERWVKAYHGMQDAGGYWYVVTEDQDDHLEVSAVDIHHLYDLLDEMRRSAQNVPGVEIYIDNPHRAEGGDDREMNRDYQKPIASKTAKAKRRAKA
jgi:hypothetical protein